MTDSDDDDKTRIAPNKGGSEPADDRTRIAPRKGNPAPAPSDDSDKTRVVSPAQDRTRIAPSARREAAKTSANVSAQNKAVPPQQDKKVSSDVKKVSSDVKSRISQKINTADKTRIASSRQRKIEETLPASEEATILAPRDRGDSPGSMPGDKTQFTPSALDRNKPPVDNSSKIETVVSADISQRDTTGPQIDPEAAKAKEDALKEGGAHGIIKERFILEELLGAGGMGEVYKAKDLLKVEAQDRDPYVAIKVLSDDFKSHPEAFIALQRESRKSQRIAHPNIVNVHDFDRDGDDVFMTMEFLQGMPLDQKIRKYKSTGLPHDEVWKILEGISAALIHAHAKEIIHSDFKPGNIFVTDEGTAKVFDFGIARAVAKAEKFEESVDDKTVFDAGSLGALTPAYASYEMLEGMQPDIRDDIYALGCIAYELFTGQHPYKRVHADEALKQKLKPKPIPGISKRHWKVIESALALKREDRVATVDEFWEKLTQKKTSIAKFAITGILMAAVIGVAVFQLTPAPQQNISEDEVRSEIEQKLRLEQQIQTVNELVENAEFTAAWENRLWQAVQAARESFGLEDAWLIESEGKIYQAYLKEIEERFESTEFDRIKALSANAMRYTADSSALDDWNKRVDEAILAEKKRLAEEERKRQLAAKKKKEAAEKRRVAAKNKSEFDTAIANVDKQLSCRSNVNMKDLEIAVNKLRSLSASRYKSEEPRITSSLALCLEKIGKSFPKRAKESKKAAVRIFPANNTVANIKIVPKDPCGKSLAGFGARGKRAQCRDKIKSVGRGPSLVVIPAKGSIPMFAISKYEISTDDLNEFCKRNGACKEYPASLAGLPATNISIDVVKAYLSWLTEKTDKKYRLPTRSEWSYAAKAKSDKLDANRNCILNSRGILKGGVLIKASIGQQNGWGIVNYVGNAQEFVADKGGRLYAMGGSYQTPMQECNLDSRASHDGKGDEQTGFRVLREIPVQE